VLFLKRPYQEAYGFNTLEVQNTWRAKMSNFSEGDASYLGLANISSLATDAAVATNEQSFDFSLGSHGRGIFYTEDEEDFCIVAGKTAPSRFKGPSFWSSPSVSPFAESIPPLRERLSNNRLQLGFEASQELKEGRIFEKKRDQLLCPEPIQGLASVFEDRSAPDRSQMLSGSDGVSVAEDGKESKDAIVLNEVPDEQDALLRKLPTHDSQRQASALMAIEESAVDLAHTTLRASGLMSFSADGTVLDNCSGKRQSEWSDGRADTGFERQSKSVLRRKPVDLDGSTEAKACEDEFQPYAAPPLSLDCNEQNANAESEGHNRLSVRDIAAAIIRDDVASRAESCGGSSPVLQTKTDAWPHALPENAPRSPSSNCLSNAAPDISVSTIFAEPRSSEMVESLRRHVEELETERTRLLSELDLMRLNMERRFGLVEREIAETKLSIIRSLSTEDRSEKFEASQSATSEFASAQHTAVCQSGILVTDVQDTAEQAQTVLSSRVRVSRLDCGSSDRDSSFPRSRLPQTSESERLREASELKAIVANELQKTDTYGNMLKAWQTIFKPLGKHVDKSLFRQAVIKLVRNHWLSDRSVTDAQKLTTKFIPPPDDVILGFWNDIVGDDEGATMQWKHYVELYASARH
jgi:hypothetical protein